MTYQLATSNVTNRRTTTVAKAGPLSLELNGRSRNVFSTTTLHFQYCHYGTTL